MSQELVVYTDLDGTLLDHDTYDWSPAAPMLAHLERLAIPVVIVTSKTRAEVASLRRELQNGHPYIVENGAVTVVPEGYFTADGVCPATPDAPVRASVPGRPRAALQPIVAALREELGLHCVSFAELGIAGICEHTGLDPRAAELAQQREASEPLLWRDDDAAFDAFAAALHARGLGCVRGGRFVHVLGGTDKAAAVRELHGRYCRSRPGAKRAVLGDGPNDLGMLAEADVAIVVRGRHRHPLPLGPDVTRAEVIRTAAPGPEGWRSAMAHVLRAHGYPCDPTAMGD